jgi:tetratricopeptide (TPR) repeat protein
VPTPLEAEISSLLSQSGDPQEVAEQLLHRWKHRMLSEAEQIDCAQFLIAAGLFPTFFATLARLAQKQERLPWGQIAEAVGRSHLQIDEDEVHALLTGAQQQDALHELVRSHRLDAVDSQFSRAREKIKEEKRSDLQNKLEFLKEKLVFMRNNRLFEQEAEVIREIQTLFPEQTEAAAELKSLQFRWAREIVGKHQETHDVTADLHWKMNNLSPELNAAKKLIVERAKDFAQKDPALAYDLALSLHSMDFNAEAVDILSLAHEIGRGNEASDWLRLELMVLARQFVTALEEASRLELKYASDPEATFAANYARARALKGLGRTDMAIELLRSLVRIRPNYKSTQSLLLEWAGDEA